MLWPVVNFTRSQAGCGVSDVTGSETDDWVGSVTAAEKSNFLVSTHILLASWDSALGAVCSLDMDISELALAAVETGNKESIPEALYVETKESVLAATESLELDADEIKLLDEAADAMRLFLARLRRDEDETVLPLAPTSAAFASSMSRSLSSLRWLIIWCKISG